MAEMSQPLQHLEEELRAAVACWRYQDVIRLATQLDHAAQAWIRSLPKGDARISATASYMRDLIGWALVMAQAGRAACAAEIQQLATATRYLTLDADPLLPVSFSLDA